MKQTMKCDGQLPTNVGGPKPAPKPVVTMWRGKIGCGAHAGPFGADAVKEKEKLGAVVMNPDGSYTSVGAGGGSGSFDTNPYNNRPVYQGP